MFLINIQVTKEDRLPQSQQPPVQEKSQEMLLVIVDLVKNIKIAAAL